MKVVIVGLGNPEPHYEGTRHNIGRDFLLRVGPLFGAAAFAAAPRLEATTGKATHQGVDILFMLPDTGMNRSGRAVAQVVKSVAAARKLLVVRDDLDMPIGALKMTFGRGSGGHRGIESIARALKTKEFAQLKVGIAPRTPAGAYKKVRGEEAVSRHVLGTFSPKEQSFLTPLMKRMVCVIERYLVEGVEAAMMEANTKR